MKKLNNIGKWWSVASLIIACIVAWYLSASFEQPLIFAICAIAVVVAAGYWLTKEQEKLDKKEREALDSILTKIDLESEERIEENKRTAAKIEDIAKTLSSNIDTVGVQLSDQQDAAAERTNDLINSLISKSDTNTALLIKKIETVNNVLLDVTPNVRSVVNETKDNVMAAIAQLNTQVEKEASMIKRTQKANADQFQRNAEQMVGSLDSLGDSFENAVEAYQEMEKRMAALEQQNVHLQHLTTLIGTVRSDIAAINEIRGFVDEHKAGQKVRIVRDDENRIVVENLMNGDGVRILKSKMYNEKNLIFEAEFNEVGKMILSRSYDKKGDLDTEVTYALENNGQPTLRDVMKEKIIGAFGKKKW